eukprot:gene8825-biopygen3161
MVGAAPQAPHQRNIRRAWGNCGAAGAAAAKKKMGGGGNAAPQKSLTTVPHMQPFPLAGRHRGGRARRRTRACGGSASSRWRGSHPVDGRGRPGSSAGSGGLSELPGVCLQASALSWRYEQWWSTETLSGKGSRRNADTRS